ncbi:MAG: hypothetical protein EOL89_00205 [Actinobacteria bacterium]|nr:hypothetical protein [Actinomycetota bacterium]
MSQRTFDADFLDHGPTSTLSAVRQPQWPILVVLLLSAGALVVAPFRVFEWSAVAYGLVLVVGSVLMFLHRVNGVVATRAAGAVGVTRASVAEKAAIAAMVAACMLNGLVIAWELATR